MGEAVWWPRSQNLGAVRVGGLGRWMRVVALLACHFSEEAFVFWSGLGWVSKAVHDDVGHVSGGGLVFDVGVLVKGVEERHQVGAGSRSGFGVRHVRKRWSGLIQGHVTHRDHRIDMTAWQVWLLVVS